MKEKRSGNALPILTCKKGVEITSGCYSTVEELIEVIQADWEKNHFNLTIKVVDQRIKIENKNKELFDITLEISPYLSFALGFAEELDLNSSSIFRIRDSGLEVEKPILLQLFSFYEKSSDLSLYYRVYSSRAGMSSTSSQD